MFGSKVDFELKALFNWHCDKAVIIKSFYYPPDNTYILLCSIVINNNMGLEYKIFWPLGGKIPHVRYIMLEGNWCKTFKCYNSLVRCFDEFLHARKML